MQVQEILLDYPGRITFHTQSGSVYTCEAPGSLSKRHIEKNGVMLFFGALYGVAVPPEEAGALFSKYGAAISLDEPLADGRIVVMTTSIKVGQALAMVFTNEESRQQDCLATSPVTRIDIT